MDKNFWQRGESSGIMPMVVLAAVAAGIFFYIASSSNSPFTQFSAGNSGAGGFRRLLGPTVTDAPTGLSFDFPSSGNDSYSNPHGPYFMNILKAETQDDVAFTLKQTVLDKAQVTDAVVHEDTIIVVGNDGAKRSRSGIVSAVSQDGGNKWKKGSLRIRSKVNTLFQDASIIKTADGYRIFYIGFGGKDNPLPHPGTVNTSNKIFSATSEDGINFTEEEGIRLDGHELSYPDVVEVNGRWVMYVMQGSELVRAISDDGLIFTIDGGIRNQTGPSNTFAADDGGYRQFYCDGGIKSARSSDGFSWTDEAGYRLPVPRNALACFTAAVQTEAGTVLFYSSRPR